MTLSSLIKHYVQSVTDCGVLGAAVAQSVGTWPRNCECGTGASSPPGHCRGEYSLSMATAPWYHVFVYTCIAMCICTVYCTLCEFKTEFPLWGFIKVNLNLT